MHIPLGTPFAHAESSQHENRKKLSLANMLSSDLPHGVPYLPKKGRYLLSRFEGRSNQRVLLSSVVKSNPVFFLLAEKKADA